MPHVLELQTCSAHADIDAALHRGRGQRHPQVFGDGGSGVLEPHLQKRVHQLCLLGLFQDGLVLVAQIPDLNQNEACVDVRAIGGHFCTVIPPDLHARSQQEQPGLESHMLMLTLLQEIHIDLPDGLARILVQVRLELLPTFGLLLQQLRNLSSLVFALDFVLQRFLFRLLLLVLLVLLLILLLLLLVLLLLLLVLLLLLILILFLCSQDLTTCQESATLQRCGVLQQQTGHELPPPLISPALLVIRLLCRRLFLHSDVVHGIQLSSLLGLQIPFLKVIILLEIACPFHRAHHVLCVDAPKVQ
mmetsp:Transcript_43856/g.71259  ORF Transcript_43856/g.71259 Transcript_43856/m.71259 type:complete len:303 (-) Transcript_43856:904-1812(-)